MRRMYGKSNPLAQQIIARAERYRLDKARRKAREERYQQAFLDSVWRGFR